MMSGMLGIEGLGGYLFQPCRYQGDRPASAALHGGCRGDILSRQDAENDWKVIATMRNIAKGEALAQLPNVEVVKLDVSNHAEIKQVVADVLAKYDVDVVFNNVGYGLMAPLEVPTEERHLVS